MALAFATAVRARAAVLVPGTSVAPTTVIPDNCHTILFLNRSGNLVLIGNGVAGAAIPDDGVSGTPLLANAGLTWAVGVLALRPSTLDDLIYDAVGGAANVDITYLCTSGVG